MLGFYYSSVLYLGKSEKFQPYYEDWNNALGSALSQFASSHPEATTFIFSSWDTFIPILDSPTGHGFKTTDPMMSRGGIWLDGLHPTSVVHKILAEDIAKFQSLRILRFDARTTLSMFPFFMRKLLLAVRPLPFNEVYSDLFR